MRAGNVRQFAGRLTTDTWDDEEVDDVWWRLIDRGLIEAKLSQSLALELYPHDDYLYRVNETLIREPWPIYVKEWESGSEAEQER